jgi:large subunit ribosomal protein L9
MKVVFLEDVPNVAEAGEMKEVADGYGRNFLIPRKLAVLADAKAANIIEAQLKKKARIQAETEAEMRELAQQMEGKEVILKARSGAKGQLYGSITTTEIAEELSKSTGLVVDKRGMELEEPIRQVGSYEIAIRLTKDIVPKIKVTIVGEEKEGKEKEKGKKRAKAEKTEEKVKKKAKAEKTEEKVKKTKKKVAGEEAKK